MLFISVTVKAQLHFSNSKLNIDVFSGYDDNPLKMSKESVLQPIDSYLETITSNFSSEYNWDKNILTRIDLDGDYTIFPSNSHFNDWSLNGNINTIVKLYPKYKKSILPGVYLNLGIDAYGVDKYYTDRLLGEQFESLLAFGETLKLGDLLDQFSLEVFSGIRLKFSNHMNLFIQYQINNNNYKDLGSKENQSFVALDNSENIFSTNLVVEPFNNFDILLEYSYNNRIYDYKTTRNLDKFEFTDKQRAYVYNNYKVGFDYKFADFKLSFDYKKKDRLDQFEGYYNYTYDLYRAKIYYRVTEKIKLMVGYVFAKKDYDHLTFSQKLLSNEYQDIKISVKYKLYDNLDITPMYLYDYENSTYYKFSYRRNMFAIEFSYKVF